MKPEVEKGFMRTAIGHELVDSNTQINFVNLIIPTFLVGSILSKVLKEKVVKIPPPYAGAQW